MKDDITTHFNDYPTLIKLHGCVRNASAGFVFDDEEYSAFQARDDRLINEFGDASIKNDVIFLGTEFQEDDLKYIINVFLNKGYDYNNHYFFVTPKINDLITQIKIQNTKNFYHINMCADEFFTFLHNDLILCDQLLNQLIELGLKDIAVLYDKIPIDYESKLYHGAEIKYGDLKYNWDISDSQNEIIEWVKKDDRNKLVALYGKEYVGKTCKAKRLLYSFFVLGYNCYEFSLSSIERIQCFLQYICKRVDNNVALLFEDAAFSYELLIKNIVEACDFKHKIVIITTDTLINHKKKTYSLKRNDNCKIIKVEETIDYKCAELIYEKLKEKKCLNRLLDVSSNQKIIIDYIKNNNDLIDVLYYSSLGRIFEDYLTTNIITDDVLNNKYISILLLFNEFGINQVPKFVFCKSASALNVKFNYNLFQQKTKRLLQIENNNLHLRYSRFLYNHYSRRLTHVEIISVITALIKSISDRFREGDYNEISELFYKSINLKTLLKYLDKIEVKKLYFLLEKYCEQYSYYWVQRGICAQCQDEPEFEEADRYLRLAREIRPSSYQVYHALAKNMIERGLFDIKKSGYDLNNYFDSGISDMQSLLFDPNYNRAYDYSLHAYISSWLKYSKYTGLTLNRDVCMIINESVKNYRTTVVDRTLFALFLELKKYTRKKNLGKYLHEVVSIRWESNHDSIDYEEGYIEIY